MNAERTLAVEGRTYTTPSGYVRAHPAAAVARDALKAFNTLGRQFGLSPMDGTAMPRPEERSERERSWAEDERRAAEILRD